MVVCVGLFFSRALVSIGTWMIIGNAILLPNLKQNLRAFFKNKAALAVTGIFFIALFSGLYSENVAVWWGRVQTKLPFLMLPYAFSVIKPPSLKQFRGILYFFFALTVFTSLGVLINYFFNFDAINTTYSQGQIIPTPIIYVRFSLMVVFAFVVGAYLWLKNYELRWRWERVFIKIGTIFLFVFTHILAVRTGLLALYLLIGLGLFYYIFTQKRYVLGSTIAMVILALPLMSYQLIPSFQNKVHYMKWDLEQYFKGNQNQMASDYMRLVSIESGLKVMKTNSVLFGAGYGDLRTEMDKIYAAEYPTIPKKLLPHNQFVFAMAATGLVGLVVLIISVFFPLFYRDNYKNLLFLAFHLIILSSFIAETPIELQIGHTFYLIFLLLMMMVLNDQRLIKGQEKLSWGV